MSNLQLIDKDVIEGVKLLIDKDHYTSEELEELNSQLMTHPNILSNLTLEQVIKLDKLGIDLAPCIKDQSLSNMKVFVFKYASDSMSRVAKLVDRLEIIENILYDRYTVEGRYMDPSLALQLISTIQSSISQAVQLLTKLTDNDVLMNLIFDVKQINNNITINEESTNDTRQILPKESRAKVLGIFEQALKVINDETSNKSEDSSTIIDAEVVNN